jgi:hypothetical protein
VIQTGTGGGFILRIDFLSFGKVADPDAWSQVHDEGIQILENTENKGFPANGESGPENAVPSSS